MQYTATRSVISALALDPKLTAVREKHSVWAYEKEWRLFIEPGLMTGAEKHGLDREVTNFPHDAIACVIAGVHTPRCCVDLVNHLCRSLDPPPRALGRVCLPSGFPTPVTSLYTSGSRGEVHQAAGGYSSSPDSSPSATNVGPGAS